MNDALDRIIAEIKTELPRSLSLHPPEEWAGFDLPEMLLQLDKEIDEIWKAYKSNDYQSPHGVYKECVHSIVVLLRTVVELERRGK